MPDLEDAINLALQKHWKQVDKAGKPYILHPLQVMLKMGTEQEMIVAVLHDIIEDSDLKLQDLKNMGYAGNIIKTLDALTKRDRETYQTYINRVTEDPVAIKVKLADLEDNMQIERISNPEQNDFDRIEKYTRAYDELKRVFSKS